MGTNGPFCGGDAALSKSATYDVPHERSSSRSRSSRVCASPRVSSFASFGVGGSGPTGRVCRGISGRVRASPRASSSAPFSVVGSGPHKASLPVQFRSCPRVTPWVVFRVVRRRRIGPSRGESSGGFPVASVASPSLSSTQGRRAALSSLVDPHPTTVRRSRARSRVSSTFSDDESTTGCRSRGRYRLSSILSSRTRLRVCQSWLSVTC